MGKLRAGEGQDDGRHQRQADGQRRLALTPREGRRPPAPQDDEGHRDEQCRQPPRVGEVNGHGGTPAIRGPTRPGPLRR